MTDKIANGTTLKDVDETGAFKRKAANFRNNIEYGGTYPPAKGRYILYVSYACPWASRCIAYRLIKGLEDVVALAVASPIWAKTKPDVDGHEGWVFDPSYPGATADPLGKFTSARDIYDLSMKNTGDAFDTRYTVPILFDSETMTIVNNESSEIIRIFNSAFNGHCAKPEVDMSPAELLPAIDAMNDKTYEPICNGVYKCGFAQTQEAYNDAVATLFAALESVGAVLTSQRYLVSQTAITEADIRLFCCLVRFDEVYVVHFKCSKKMIHEYPFILNWMRDVYQTLGLRSTVNMQHIKDHYYCSHLSINPFGIVPVGCDFVAMIEQHHNRA